MEKTLAGSFLFYSSGFVLDTKEKADTSWVYLLLPIQEYLEPVNFAMPLEMQNSRDSKESRVLAYRVGTL